MMLCTLLHIADHRSRWHSSPRSCYPGPSLTYISQRIARMMFAREIIGSQQEIQWFVDDVMHAVTYRGSQVKMAFVPSKLLSRPIIDVHLTTNRSNDVR